MNKRASGRFVLRMDPSLHAVLRTAARAAGTSLNDYCVRKLALPGEVSPAGAGRVVARASTVAAESLVGVAVFGSWARGEATERSDVDILVAVDANLEITRELYRRWDEEPIQWDSRDVEPHFVQLPEAGSRLTGFWAEVALEGIVLFERGFALSRRLVQVRSQIAAGAAVRRWSNGHPYWVAA
jgi:hypothetical protein